MVDEQDDKPGDKGKDGDKKSALNLPGLLGLCLAHLTRACLQALAQYLAHLHKQLVTLHGVRRYSLCLCLTVDSALAGNDSRDKSDAGKSENNKAPLTLV